MVKSPDSCPNALYIVSSCFLNLGALESLESTHIYQVGTHHMPGTVRGWLMGGRGLLLGTRSEARCKTQTGLDIECGWEGRRFVIPCSCEVPGRFLQERLEQGARKGSSGLLLLPLSPEALLFHCLGFTLGHNLSRLQPW